MSDFLIDFCIFNGSTNRSIMKLLAEIFDRVRRESKLKANLWMNRYKQESIHDFNRDKDSDLAEIYENHEGLEAHKWHSYLPVYERYLDRFRGQPVRFLEIGVQYGGSLQIWRKYFGTEAQILGVDIHPLAGRDPRLQEPVRTGDQSDCEFLQQVFNEMGGIDVVLDDGSHRMRDIATSFEFLFPLLPEGGLYIIEDVSATFWRDYRGSMGGPLRNISSYLQRLILDQHHQFHPYPVRNKAVAAHIGAIHSYPGIIVIEKRKLPEPQHSRVGKSV